MAEAVTTKSAANIVLLVDDNALILEVIEIRLRREKFLVVSFTDPLDALDFFTHYPDNVAALVSDIRMPRMNGIRLAKRMRAINPALPVILMTGYHVSNEVDRKWIADNVQEVLQKPTAAREAVEAVRRAVAGRKTVEDRGTGIE